MKTIFELYKRENVCETFVAFFESKLEAEKVARLSFIEWVVRPKELYQDYYDYDINSKVAKRQRALAKLTHEERVLLGLTTEG